ncbi:MAG: hypothetical protein ACTHKS_08155 [Gaiellaceae bacterium]
MTDILVERFAALADPTDDSNWLDVRRRARRAQTRVAVAAAVLAATVAVATALAAGSGWVFNTHQHRVTAATSLSLNGSTWKVSITSGAFGRLCFRISGASATPSAACTGRLGGLHHARPFGAVVSKISGGQLWAGASIGFARRISITTTEGRSYTADTMAAPKGTKTPFRYWAIAVTGTASSITAYDAHGRSIRKSLAGLK